MPIAALGHPNDPIRICDSSGIPPEAQADTVVCRWNDFEALERVMALHGRDTACVVTEGVMSNMGVIPPKPGYLLRMQELCQQHGFLHAGIVSTALDSACGYAAYSLMPADAAVLTAIKSPQHASLEYAERFALKLDQVMKSIAETTDTWIINGTDGA